MNSEKSFSEDDGEPIKIELNRIWIVKSHSHLRMYVFLSCLRKTEIYVWKVKRIYMFSEELSCQWCIVLVDHKLECNFFADFLNVNLYEYILV
jgi:hypothetical protein